MLARERLPEQHPDGPHVAGRGGVASGEPFRGDVRERPGHVADGGQRVGLVELGQAEVEQADRKGRRLLHEHVRRLHVAVDDPEAVRVRKGIEDLRARLDGLPVAELP